MNKTIKVIIIVLAGLAALVMGAQIWANNKFGAAVKNGVVNISGKPYLIDAGKARVSLFSRSATLQKVTLGPDSTSAGLESGMTFALASPRIRITGINLGSLLGKNDIRVGRVTVFAPRGVVETHPEKQEKAIERDKPGQGKGIRIKAISIRRANIRYITHNRGKRSEWETQEFDFDLGGFYIPAGSTGGELNQDSILPSFDGFSFSTRKIVNINTDGSVILTIDSLRLDSDDGSLSLSALQLQPQYPKETFVRQSVTKEDWTQVITGPIECYGLDFEEILNTKTIRADSVLISSADIQSYKDRNADQPQRVKKLFFESVQQLPMRVHAGVIRIGPTRATYWEVPAGGSTAGRIFFSNLTGSFHGLTNIPGADNYYTLTASGNMYGAGHLTATFFLPVEERTNHFEVKGRLGSMDMKLLNEMLIPLAHAEAEKGQINSMDFHIAGSAAQSHVNLTLLYDNLKIELLKNERTGFKERRFLSWVANSFVIEDHNPGRLGPRHGSGTTQRDYYRSQFNYLWRSLLPGIKETAGL